MYNVLSRKFKRVSLKETPEFPYWGQCIGVNVLGSTYWGQCIGVNVLGSMFLGQCIFVDFNFRNQKTKRECKETT